MTYGSVHSIDLTGHGVHAVSAGQDPGTAWRIYLLEFSGTETGWEVRCDPDQARALLEQLVEALYPEQSAEVLAVLP